MHSSEQQMSLASLGSKSGTLWLCMPNAVIWRRTKSLSDNRPSEDCSMINLGTMTVKRNVHVVVSGKALEFTPLSNV